MYLTIEVTQQSKARHKDDFVVAFSPVIADATASAYRGAPTDVQGKLRRVIDVWKDRGIFEVPIQEAIEARIQGKETCWSLPIMKIPVSNFSSRIGQSPWCPKIRLRGLYIQLFIHTIGAVITYHSSTECVQTHTVYQGRNQLGKSGLRKGH